MSNLVEHGYDICGTTAQRPTLGAVETGFRYFDITIGQLLVWNGTAWVTGLVVEERTFTEDGAGTYTAEVAVPAGATIHDIIINAVALWAAASSAAMKVGDGDDDDGYFTDVNLKATDLLAGESISFSHQGGQGGAYFVGTNTHVAPRYSATARTISGVVTSVGAGTTGRTRMTVVYSLPGNIEAAVKS